MFRSFAGRLVAILVLTIGVIALAFGAYNAGVSAGAASAGATEAGAATVHLVYGFGGVFPWLFFFPIGFFLFIFIIGSIFRAARWGGRGYGGRGYGGYPGNPGNPGGHGWGGGMGSRLEDWHRQAHEQQSGTPTPPGAGGTTNQAGQGAPR